MNQFDFDTVEKKLGITLPTFYKNAIINYPFKAQDDLDDIEDSLVCDHKWLIDENIELREKGFFDQEWPNYFYAFGKDGFGNYYFINLRDDDQSIYFADHEETFNYENIEEMRSNWSMDDFIEDQIDIRKETVSEG